MPAGVQGCRRCGGLHGGLCARIVVGATAVALRAAGAPLWTWDDDAASHLRQRSIAIVDGIVTKHGRDRARAIAACGRPVVALVDGVVRLWPMPCRDRLCASCQRKRARKIAAELRTALTVRTAEVGDAIDFGTLTFPKPRDLDPAAALAKLRAYWRRLTNTKTSRGRGFHRRFAGGVRSFEVTWSAKGERRSDGTVVPYDGWHAHVHMLIEHRGRTVEAQSAAWDWLLRTWCEMVSGSARAQHHSPMDSRRVGQLAMYVAKPLDDTCPLALARKLALALHGKRMHAGFGTWKTWRDMLPPRSAPPVVAYAHAPGEDRRPMALVEVYRAAKGANAETTPVHFRVRGSAEPLLYATAADVWDGILAWAKRESDTRRAERSEPDATLAAVDDAWRRRAAPRAPPVVQSRA